MITREEIEAAKSEKGGWTKATLAGWGIPWPPPTGWKETLIAGGQFEANQFTPSPIRSDVSAHDLLRQVVLAVIDAGHSRDLDEYPDVLAYFGARNPSAEELAEAGVIRA
jgi:hypothetical protein